MDAKATVSLTVLVLPVFVVVARDSVMSPASA